MVQDAIYRSGERSFRGSIYALDGRNDILVFTKTDLESADYDGNIVGENFCNVYFSLSDFITGDIFTDKGNAVDEDDCYFYDDKDARDEFPEMLDKAWSVAKGIRNRDRRLKAFKVALYEEIGHAWKAGFTEIFKLNPELRENPECGAPKVTDKERAVIKEFLNGEGYHSYCDDANGFYAFDLPSLSREECDSLVMALNELSEYEDGNWWLGNEDEEYVHVD